MTTFSVGNYTDEGMLLAIRDGEGITNYEITTDQAEALAKDLMTVVNENRELERREKLEFNYEVKQIRPIISVFGSSAPKTEECWVPCKLISRKYEACFVQFEDGSMMVAHESNVRERKG